MITELPTLEEILEVDDLQEGIEGSVSAHEGEHAEKEALLKSLWDEESINLQSGKYGKYSSEDRFKYPEYNHLNPENVAPQDTLHQAIDKHINSLLVPGSEPEPIANRAIQAAANAVLVKFREKQSLIDRQKAASYRAREAELPGVEPITDDDIEAARSLKKPGQIFGGDVEAAEEEAAAKAKADRGSEYEQEKAAAAERIAAQPKNVQTPDFDDSAMRMFGMRPGWSVMFRGATKKVEKQGADGKVSGAVLVPGQYVQRVKRRLPKNVPDDAQPIGKRKVKDPKTGLEKEVDVFEPPVRQSAGSWEPLDPKLQKALDDSQLLRNERGDAVIMAFKYSKDPSFWVLRYKGAGSPAKAVRITGSGLDLVATGTAEECQKAAEEKSGKPNDEAAKLPDIETPQRGVSNHFDPKGAVPAAPQTPRDPSLDIDSDPSIDINAANEVQYLNDNPNDGIKSWGNFWISKTADEIEKLKINPKDIDTVMLQDPRFDEDNEFGTASENRAKKVALIAKRMALRTELPNKKKDDKEQHFRPKSGMTGLKTAEFTTKTNSGEVVMKKERVPDWKMPPIGYDSDGKPIDDPGTSEAPIQLRHRKEMASLVPMMRDFIKKFGKYAMVSQKDPRTQALIKHVAIDPETGQERKVNHQLGPEDIDGRERCDNCHHPARDHLSGDKSSYVSCRNPDCKKQIELRSGGTAISSKCSHFVPSGRLERNARMKQQLTPSLALQMLDDLAELPSRTGGIGMTDPPFTKGQIAQANRSIKWAEERAAEAKENLKKAKDEDKARLAQLYAQAEEEVMQARLRPKIMEQENAEFQEMLDPEQLKETDIDITRPPFTYEQLVALRDTDKEAYAKAQKKQRTWRHMLKKQTQDSKTASSEVGKLSAFIDNIKGHLAKEKQEKGVDKVKNLLKGVIMKSPNASQMHMSDPRVESVFDRVVRDIIFGERAGPDLDASSKGTGEVAIGKGEIEYDLEPDQEAVSVSGKPMKVKGTPGQYGGYKGASGGFASAASSPGSVKSRAKQLQSDIESGFIKPGDKKEIFAKIFIALSGISDAARESLRKMYAQERSTITGEADPQTGVSAVSDLSDELLPHIAAIDALRKLAGELRGSGGRGAQADKRSMDRGGPKINYRDVNAPKKKKGKVMSFADPAAPVDSKTNTTAAVRNKEAAAEREAEVAKAGASAEAERIARQRPFKGAPKTTGVERPMPPVEPAILRPTGAATEDDIKKKLEDMLANLDSTIKEAAVLSTADRIPHWSDDI